MCCKGLIFDLDGTLLDTLEDLAASANQALAEHGLPVHPLASYRYFVGDGLRTLVERIVPETRRDEESIEALSQSFRRIYAQGWRHKSQPYPGIEAMLEGLRERGLHLAVLSNKPHDFTGMCVRELLSGHPFDPVLGVRDGGPKKPDPSGALAIIRAWELRPEELLYLGDTATDMHTANRAGIFAVGACWGFRTAEELLESGAGALIERPEDLLNLVDERL